MQNMTTPPPPPSFSPPLHTKRATHLAKEDLRLSELHPAHPAQIAETRLARHPVPLQPSPRRPTRPSNLLLRHCVLAQKRYNLENNFPGHRRRYFSTVKRSGEWGRGQGLKTPSQQQHNLKNNISDHGRGLLQWES